ncbi:hypothetical protein CAEBREN_01570 [Caenorhabditis brenneri]|uniref:Uncharacterized protein n=1 Tax=Caenorhabditis brenneri TaxID=135651 RepID=G0NIV5_CAEBE|nr:hypothetical protein CAEBREN_01570 [Caenorhabditis brenneri]
MSDRYKCEFLSYSSYVDDFISDAKNGIYKCENFAQHVEQDRFPEIHIGLIGGMWRWYDRYSFEN